MGLGAFRRGRPWPHFQFEQGTGHKLEIETIRRASAVAATTHAVLHRVARDVPEVMEKARVYPYPFSPAPSLLAAEADGNGDAVIYVGRLEPRKGVLDLAAAIPGLCSRHPDMRFRFVGRDIPSGIAGKSCSKLILQQAGSFRDRVEILPAQSRERALEIIASSKICVFPSHWESFGIVVLEAMAAARPVVVTKGSGMAELIEAGKTGLAAEPRNPARLTEEIDKLWKNPALRRGLGEAARDSVLHRFSVPHVLKVQIAHYRDIVGRPTPRKSGDGRSGE